MIVNHATQQTALLLSAMSRRQLGAAERFLLSIPSLTEGALVSASIGHRTRLSYVAIELTLEATLRNVRTRQRLAFWAAREGGWARGVERMEPEEAERFRATFASCDVVLRDVSPAHWAESVRRVFAAAGCAAPPELASAPELRLDVGGRGWNGFRFDPAARLLHVPSPLCPPAGDVLRIALTPAGAPGETCTARATVVGIVRPADATPSSPAGFTLALDDASADAATILAARCGRLAEGNCTRAAPRHAVVCAARLAGSGEELPADPDAALCDLVTNLSHGGAFVRTATPRPIGSRAELHLRLPPGRDVVLPATVMRRGPGGVGVRFDHGPEIDAALASALASLVGRPRRVLVVDDDAFSRKVIADELGARGFECVTATGGEEGLRTIAEELLTLDAVVTDVVMPGLSGDALVSRVRDAGGERGLVVVAVTADPSPELERRLDAQGADAVVGKAAGPAALVEEVEAALERRRLGNEGRAAPEEHRAIVA
jgi:CheY-like chemotaxis protein